MFEITDVIKMEQQYAYTVPWVDKYRPKTLSDVAGNVSVIDRLRAFAVGGTFPNMSFIGPPGVGKTTAAICLTNDTFKGRGVFKILNASKDRGINVIRNEVTQFASHRSLSAAFKVLIMDEADYITDKAQPALREVIGQNSRNCRFILICNEGERLIEALTSRCPPMYFDRLTESDITQVLIKILTAEKKSITQPALTQIVLDSFGDLRTAINRLETACMGVQRVDDVSFMGSPQMYYSEQVILAAMRSFEQGLEEWYGHSQYTNARKFLERCVRVVHMSEDATLDRKYLARCLAQVDWTRGGEDVQVLGLLANLSDYRPVPGHREPPSNLNIGLDGIRRRRA